MTHPHEFQGIVTKLRTTKGSPYALDVMKEAADRIDAVLDLHRHDYTDSFGGLDGCVECSDFNRVNVEWPCPTVRALGVEASSSQDTTP